MYNLARGSKSNPSVFGIKTCSAGDWIALATFISVCVVVSYYALQTMRRETFLKENYGQGLCKSDIKAQSNDVIKLLACSFFGGWVSGAVGLGGGSVFNPLLLSLGVAPTVSSATGMYMIIFSTAASTLVYMLNDQLNIFYALWIGMFCSVGTIIGMKLINFAMSRMGRQSPLVALLTFVLFIAAIAVVYFGIIELVL